MPKLGQTKFVVHLTNPFTRAKEAVEVVATGPDAARQIVRGHFSPNPVVISKVKVARGSEVRSV